MNLTWVIWRRTVSVYNVYSDQDMACPGSYYGGFKESRVLKWGTAERTLSDRWTGEWQGSTFSFSLSDYDQSIRQRLVSATDRYWTLPLEVFMVSRATRAALGPARLVFVGNIIEAQPRAPLAFDITIADLISQGILSDEMAVPWRKIRDGFLQQLLEISDDLDVDTPEPIIYGEHRRVPDVDPASPQGFVYKPTLLGKETVAGNPWWVWLVAGHACADIPDIYVDAVSKIADESTKWLVPHHAGWTAQFTNHYVDKTSDTYLDTRRYSLIYGKVGQTDPDAVAAGTAKLTVSVKGVEANGDGTGTVISDRLLQYKHFAVNFLANQGKNSYMSGAWLTNPSWALFDQTVPIVDTTSFDDCSAIAITRLPPDGYVGAAILGASAGDIKPVRARLADWNRSCGTQYGWTHLGRMRVCMLNPTAANKAAAQLFTDVNDILDGSFNTALKWSDWANAIPFKADFEHASGQWKTVDVATWDASITNYARTVTAEPREYPFAPGITMSYHLARLEAILRQDPPRIITLAGNCDDDGIGLLDLGDYIRYSHFAEVGTSKTQIRLAQIQRVSVDVSAKKVFVEAVDCEDFIDYDQYITPTGTESMPVRLSEVATLVITTP